MMSCSSSFSSSHAIRGTLCRKPTQHKSLRLRVRAEAPRAKFGGTWSKPQAPEVRVGQQAVVEGLVNRVELNGATCRVVGQSKQGELEVTFLAGLGKPVDKEYYQNVVLIEPKYLKPVNTTQADEPKASPKAQQSGNLMSKVYEGTVSRLFGFSLDSGYEPGTVEAIKEGKCPRCGAVITPDMPPHKSNWCDACQKGAALFDVSNGF
uniref:Uncharacterized protein n=1 Tax=Pyramimonas obovata TaxID=1411642 RepID=A0A7S0RTE5_9CHLO|mmetsp:Transcript_6314/g.12825  ORF Transcript_6314/g.12825 Transcript_6314/m.12825 type:complete len:207 (+) Transcript_6314:75-695(+)